MTVHLTRLTRRAALVSAMASALTAWAAPSLAQQFPERPVRLVTPFAAGAGAMDTAARVMSEKMAAKLNSPVVVVNQPGAGGTLAAGAVARGPKDGYSVYFGTSATLGYAKMLNKDVTYDPVEDFTPVAMLGIVPVGLFVPASSPIRNLQDLIAAAKANPGGLNFGSPGIGTVTHIAVEMLMDRAGIQMKHVPYGSGPNYWADLASGQLQVVSAGISGGLPLVKDGRVRMIATATGARTQAVPDVPAVGESFPGYDAPAWIGLAVPRGTPEPVVAKLESAAMATFRDPDTKATLGRAGIEVSPLDRQAFAKRIDSDVAGWQSTFKKSGLLAK